jgi:hypothetical protein
MKKSRRLEPPDATGPNSDYNLSAPERQASVRQKIKINLQISLEKNPAQEDFNGS